MSLAKVYDMLMKLKNAGRKERLMMLERFCKDEDFRRVVEYTYSNDVYGVSPITEELPKVKALIPPDESDFFRFLDRLKGKSVVSKSEREQLKNLMSMFGEKEQYVMNLILGRDLKCGVGYETFAKYIPTIRSGIQPMLAKYSVVMGRNEDDLKKFFNESDELVYVNYKYDGIRLLTIIENGEITFQSRNMKVFKFPFLENKIKELGFDNCILDGELIFEGNDFQLLMRLIRRKSWTPREWKMIERLEYYVFDVIDENRDKGIPIDVIEGISGDRIYGVKYWEIEKDVDEVKEMFWKAKRKGMEGLMLKYPKYEFKRSKYWCKVKGCDTIDGVVIDVIEGNGRLKGMVGALLVKGENGVTFRVSGIPDELRKKWWENKDEIIGKTIEVKYQELTKDGKPRFPSFVKIRYDR